MRPRSVGNFGEMLVDRKKLYGNRYSILKVKGI